ncbi:MAG TPA: hypothetical protein VHO06_17150 [Polyangia bacterium]|nr:hypothetical protein [Polyangia bacterium]
MPNTFQVLDVPTGDATGVPFVASALGRPKTIVFAGPVLGRYVVEGSNDGGTSWDILVDDDGEQALFTSQAPGVRNFDAIVGQIRARSIGNSGLATPPMIALGAPPAVGTPVFGVLDVPAAPGSGAVFDLGLSAGPFKTFILRGSIPPGSRYSIQGSMDGQSFQEVILFTSDQQGARPASLLCRFLRVQRDAGGPAPVIAFGSEGILEATAGSGTSEISIADDGEIETSSTSNEEVLRQYQVPLALLSAASLRATLAGQSRGGEGNRKVTYRVRAGGTADQPDGNQLLSLEDDGSGDVALDADSAPFARPSDPSTLIKLTGQGDGANAAVLRNFTLVFHP